eukprot:253925_1
MQHLSEGAIIGISFAVCLAPCVIYIAGTSIPLCNFDEIPISLHEIPLFIICFTGIGCCIGFICLAIFLTFIYTSNNIDKASLSVVYCIIFLILPCCCLFILYGYWYITIDWKYEANKKRQRQTDKAVSLALQKDKRKSYLKKTLLLMGGNTETTQKIFDNSQLIHNQSQFYKHLLLKYLIKNIQSLIIITMDKNSKNDKQNRTFMKILSTQTYGTVHLDENLINCIISTWNNENIQLTLQRLQSTNINTNTIDIDEDDDEKHLINIYNENNAINENNVVHIGFMQHFMCRKNIEKLELNDNDINILLQEHQWYKQKLYFGN